jgi:uncharacterized protein YjbI with pentapeptide repeats
MKNLLKYLSIGLLLSIIIFISSSTPQTKIYWVNFLDSFSQQLQRADLDGSNVENVLTDGVSGFSIHNVEEKIYWSNYIGGSIKRADLNGNNIENVLSGIILPGNIRIDENLSNIYWTSGNSSIYRADIDGSNVEELVNFGSAFLVDLALDLNGGKLYVKTSQPGTIQRCDLDGSNLETILQIGNDLGKIALDLTEGKIYWVVADASDPFIKRVDLDGSNEETLVSNNPTPVMENPWGITLDLQNAKIYWTDFSANKIQRSDLGGSNVEDVFTSGVNSPREIVLDMSNTTEIDDELTIPDEYVLKQNYPNPFNPSTKIKFTIPNNVILSEEKNLYLTLKVYDILGNEIATLVNESKPAGSYEAEFNASRFSTGVYFYMIKAGQFTEMKKMSLIK